MFKKIYLKWQQHHNTLCVLGLWHYSQCAHLIFKPPGCLFRDRGMVRPPDLCGVSIASLHMGVADLPAGMSSWPNHARPVITVSICTFLALCADSQTGLPWVWTRLLCWARLSDSLWWALRQGFPSVPRKAPGGTTCDTQGCHFLHDSSIEHI